MRVKVFRLALSGAALVAACSEEGPRPTPVSLVMPATGRYQARLVGYGVRGCDAALSQPEGTLESSAQFGYVIDGQVEVSGGLIWPYGAVRLRPGDPADETERLGWRGSAEVRADRSGCLLSSAVLMRYFPVDAEHGSLQVGVRYAALGTRCALRLPCEDLAFWSLSYFP